MPLMLAAVDGRDSALGEGIARPLPVSVFLHERQWADRRDALEVLARNSAEWVAGVEKDADLDGLDAFELLGKVQGGEGRGATVAMTEQQDRRSLRMMGIVRNDRAELEHAVGEGDVRDTQRLGIAQCVK